MTETVIARRYAEALFSLGRKQGVKALDAHGHCLAELGALARNVPELATVLKSPVVEVQEKKSVIGAILKGIPEADSTMRNFCFLLADKERLGLLSDIAHWYGVMLDETHGVLRGRVVTAIKLTPHKQEQIKGVLEKKVGGSIELTFKPACSVRGFAGESEEGYIADAD